MTLTELPAIQDRRRSSWFRWYVCVLLLLATTINYMDRVTLATASVRVTHEFGLSDAQYGNLELAFGWAFAVGSLVFGMLADRLPVFLLYPAVLAAWSAMGISTGWTHHYAGLLICRTCLGFFEAGHWPCALKTTYALLDERDRTMGNSVLQSGASIGAVLTPQIMKLLLTDAPGSWRHPFVVVGGVGLVWVVAWFILLRPRDLAGNQTLATKTHPLPLWSLLRDSRFWAVALLILGAQNVWHIYRVWLMKFLQSGRGYAERDALNFNSLYFIATDIGCFLAGFISLWLTRRRGVSAHLARRTVYTGACVLTSLSLLIPWLEHGWPLLVVLLFVGAGALALFPCYYSFVQEISATHLGALTGLLSMWVWALTSPLQSLFGKVADHGRDHHRYDLGLVLAGLAPWLGVIALKLLWRKPARD